MHGIIITEELRKQHEREQKIVDGIIATVGGVVAFALIAGAPLIPAIIIGKKALDKLTDSHDSLARICHTR